MLDVAGNGRYARKMPSPVSASARAACIGSRRSRQDLEQLVRADPSTLRVNVDDMQRALKEARPET